SYAPSPKNLQKLEQLGAMSQIPCGNDKPVGMTNQQEPGWEDMVEMQPGITFSIKNHQNKTRPTFYCLSINRLHAIFLSLKSKKLSSYICAHEKFQEFLHHSPH
ncbi:MAG: hypothetical protein SH848_16330, partial [Saprospiraceae bacterium]|nr:hypothetical protein [Saprospiraceae bacterium]